MSSNLKIVSTDSGVDVSDLPDSFVIFPFGEIETEKGTFVFDSAASSAVMQRAEAWGIQFIVDLEHLSLDAECSNYNPDAMGWFDVEIRDEGLYAVNVKWTDEGKRRLASKTQRYISPTFAANEESKRVESLFNVALVATPAIHNAQPLVAASKAAKVTLNKVSKVNELQAISELLGLPSDSDLETVLEALRALMASLETASTEGITDANTPDDEAPSDEETLSDDAGKDEEIAALKAALSALSAKVSGNETDSKAVFIKLHADKIPYALEDWAKSQTMESLRAFVAAAPSVKAARQPAKTADTTVTLSATEQSVAKALGVDVNKVVKYKMKGGK